MPPQPSANNRKVSSEPGRPGPGAPRRPLLRRVGALLACITVGAVAWLAILPALGELPAVRAMIDRNNAQGVDPSAKFYSELPAMPRIVDQVRDARCRQAR
jgi:hypothetical protein